MCKISSNTILKKIIKLKGREVIETEDIVAVEKKLNIYVNKKPYAQITYLPGEERELGVGILFSNKLLNHSSEIDTIDFDCSTTTLHILLKNKKKQIVKRTPSSHPVYLADLEQARSLFFSKTENFKKTGCVHSCLILSKTFKELAFGEDIGRHNAFDKAIGKLLLDNTLNNAHIGIVSSRISFEIIQKAITLGLGVLAGVSAPTSLSIDLAQNSYITLIGFFRENRMNIYTHGERIVISDH